MAIILAMFQNVRRKQQQKLNVTGITRVRCVAPPPDSPFFPPFHTFHYDRIESTVYKSIHDFLVLVSIEVFRNAGAFSNYKHAHTHTCVRTLEIVE